MAKFNEAIISIRPTFAEAILSGRKTVELRRRIPPVEVGGRLWIYATRPVAAVVGFAIIDTIFRGTPQAVWETYSDRIAINRGDFDRYFEGAREAIGIRLSTIQRIQPIGIERLRIWKEGFHPPQVLSRITASEAKRLLQMSSFEEENVSNVVRFLRA
ncbi:ASCH domain-containing protein [Rhizobium lentis]|uniref:ASCH domain-containing protein n=1 Tax=Rhizobium lentis TaxID=1138194 RepID=UPI001C832E53|nr:ASCH domain-containing protein [Rhizobium lentis]MBX4959525.1 ASCH domain-containing protein [Rhizobium lentis]MBX5032610.1 ASCH domain-containing protein [Rhizobium lentis]